MVNAAELDCQSLPFGDQQSCFADPNAPNDDANADATGSQAGVHFTGTERDAESGNDYFGTRYLSSNMGRFLSPDWSAQAEPVPYAKLENPRSLNLYSYVLNNPLNGIDPDGHIDCSGTNALGADPKQSQNGILRMKLQPQPGLRAASAPLMSACWRSLCGPTTDKRSR